MNSDLTADGDWMGWRVARCQVVDKFSYSLEIRAYIGHDPHYFLAGVSSRRIRPQKRYHAFDFDPALERPENPRNCPHCG